MVLWKQTLLALVVACIGLIGLAVFVPATRPTLDRIGLLAPIQQLGIATEVAEGSETDGGGPPGGGFGGGGGQATTVIATPIQERVLNDIVTAIGDAQAVRSVMLVPESAGRLQEILVRAGEQVTEGDVIARLDDSGERIALDRARLMLDDAQATATRLDRLQSSGTATELQISEAALSVSNAELSLREAEFALERREIIAPISGTIGLIAAEIGDQVSTQTEITRIEDRTSLLVEFRVPERLVGRLAVGTPLEATPLARPGLTLEGTITAIDNRVDQSSRSLRVRAEIANDGDMLVSGMAFSIRLEFEGEAEPAVDPLAIQWGRDGAFVWAVREGNATRVQVRIVQRNDDAVLVRGEFAEGDLIVNEGVQMLRPGGPVSVQGQEPPADLAAAPDRAEG